jgi:pantothenate kinase
MTLFLRRRCFRVVFTLTKQQQWSVIYMEKTADAFEKLGLPSNVVASSFRKLVAKEDSAKGLKQEGLARALLLMVTKRGNEVRMYQYGLPYSADA